MTTAIASAFIEDYTYLRDAGLNHDQIAQRMGVHRDSLMRRISRNQCYIPERHEVPVIEALNALLAAGEPFMVCQHFSRFAKGAVDAAIKRARADGLIEPIGWGCDGLSRMKRIWQPVEAAS